MIGYAWIKSPTNLEFLSNFGVKTEENESVFIGRASYQGELYLAQFLPSKQGACIQISQREKEVFISDYEVLVGHGFQWIRVTNGDLANKNAVSLGKNLKGDKIYIGRGTKISITLQLTENLQFNN